VSAPSEFAELAGCGLRFVPHDFDLGVEVDMSDGAVTEPSYRDNAKQVAARLATEDGATRVVEIVERLVAEG
jgi:UDP:flavonoid glycosyltransferase YjiC (YdhE family)